MNTLDEIHAELERLRNHRFLLACFASALLFVTCLAVRDARHEIKRAAVYREAAIEAMHLIPDPHDVDPIMLAIAGADDAD